MVIRSSDSRRRRAIIEEASSQLDHDLPIRANKAFEAPALESKNRVPRDYLAAAKRRHQSKATDWIPKRRPAVAFFLLGLATCLAALIGLAVLADATPAPEVASEMASLSTWQNRFSLHGGGSLSVWFSTVLLLVSSMASLQIRALRQHRSNDYRGTYRVWLWFAALLMLASINCVLDLDGLARNALAGIRGPGSGVWILSGLQWIALVAILTRGAIEVRQSPASLAMIVLVWLSYSASMILRLPGAESLIVQDDGFKAAGLELFAVASAFAAITIYSRFVYLRANGLVATIEKLPRKANVKKKTDKTSAKESVPAKKEITGKPRTKAKPKRPKSPAEPAAVVDDQPEPETMPVELRMATTISTNAESDDWDSDGNASTQFEQHENSGAKSLSKAERKRMKKLQRNVQNRRAA